MKVWQFFLTLGSAVGVTYVAPVVIAYALLKLEIEYPWNVAAVLLSMLAFVLFLMALCLREERKNREKGMGR